MHAGVPLCNLAGDEEAAHHAAMDAAFARSLRGANHLLWAEDDTLPDIVPAHQRVDEAGVPGPDPVTIDNPCAALLPLCYMFCMVQALAKVSHACIVLCRRGEIVCIANTA